MAEILGETAPLGRAKRPFGRSADRGDGMRERDREAPPDGARAENRGAQSPRGEPSPPEGGIRAGPHRRGSSERSVSVTSSS